MAKKPSFGSRIGRTLNTIKSPTFNTGFTNINMWVSAGNYAMNRLWSGAFDQALLFGRNYVFYGESGSGKSLWSAIIAGNAQKVHGAYVIWIDVERANDDKAGEEWLQRAGVDTSEECFKYAGAATLEDIKSIIAKISVDYKNQVSAGATFMPTPDQPVPDLPPIVFVVDSWAAALTSSQWEKAGGKEAGKISHDMGQFVKQLGEVIKTVTHLCAGVPLMTIGVQHIMDNQDGYGRKHKTTGGHKMMYYASGAMMLTKRELRLEDVEDGAVKDEVTQYDDQMLADVKKSAGGDKRFVGINAVMEIIKSRVSKPFSKIDVQIPYLTGIDPYSGLFSLLMQEGLISKGSPGWFEYTDGEDVKKFRKADFRDHADRLMVLADADISGNSPDIDEPDPEAVEPPDPSDL